MEIGLLENKIKSYLQKDKSYNIKQSPEKKRIKTAYFTKILKNKIFKGYEKIKFINNKKFSMNKFLKSKPEEKYLPSDAEYDIYYDFKYLNKYKPISKKDYFLLKNISVTTKSLPKNTKKAKNKSSSDLFLTEDKTVKYINKRKIKKPILFEKNNNKSNINDSTKIFGKNKANISYSKYPFIYLEKMPDDIIHPTDMRNYPHYIPKYKDKNRKQQYFLYNLSHTKEKKVKNIYHCLTPRISTNKNRAESFNEPKKTEKYIILSLSNNNIKKVKYINFNFSLNSIDKQIIKQLLCKKKNKIESLKKNSIKNINNNKIYNNSLLLNNNNNKEKNNLTYSYI